MGRCNLFWSSNCEEMDYKFNACDNILGITISANFGWTQNSGDASAGGELFVSCDVHIVYIVFAADRVRSKPMNRFLCIITHETLWKTCLICINMTFTFYVLFIIKIPKIGPVLEFKCKNVCYFIRVGPNRATINSISCRLKKNSKNCYNILIDWIFYSTLIIKW